MPSYLVESYLPRARARERSARARRARSSAEELTREGTRVRFVGSTHVLADEMCFFTFEAPSSGVAAVAAQRAGLEPLRIVEVVSSRDE